MSLNAKMFPGVFSIREAQGKRKRGEAGIELRCSQHEASRGLPECTAATDRNRGVAGNGAEAGAERLGTDSSEGGGGGQGWGEGAGWPGLCLAPGAGDTELIRRLCHHQHSPTASGSSVAPEGAETQEHVPCSPGGRVQNVSATPRWLGARDSRTSGPQGEREVVSPLSSP